MGRAIFRCTAEGVCGPGGELKLGALAGKRLCTFLAAQGENLDFPQLIGDTADHTRVSPMHIPISFPMNFATTTWGGSFSSSPIQANQRLCGGGLRSDRIYIA